MNSGKLINILDDDKNLTDKSSNFSEIRNLFNYDDCVNHSIHLGLQIIMKSKLSKSSEKLYFGTILCNHAKDLFDWFENKETLIFSPLILIYKKNNGIKSFGWGLMTQRWTIEKKFWKDSGITAHQSLQLYTTLSICIISFALPTPSTFLFQSINWEIKVKHDTKNNNISIEK